SSLRRWPVRLWQSVPTAFLSRRIRRHRGPCRTVPTCCPWSGWSPCSSVCRPFARSCSPGSHEEAIMELKHTVDIALSPAEAEDSRRIREAALAAAAAMPADAGALTARVVRRSIAARQRHVLVRLRVELWRGGVPGPVRHCAALRDVSAAPEVLIIGAGPAGYFAALQCIELGLRPTVLDRGKDVRSRRRDLR